MTPRTGPKPRTTSSNPHTQLDQNAPRALYDALAARMFALPDAEERPSRVSVPGARALWLRDGVEPGPPDAFMIEREFAHLHPARDGSLHMALPRRRAETAIASGWAELHPIARLGYLPQTVVMVFGPRNADELEVVWGLVLESYRNAGGRALP
ncbi:MAG: luciferase domain-containing protein [Polyangia bacterium]